MDIYSFSSRSLENTVKRSYAVITDSKTQLNARHYKELYLRTGGAASFERVQINYSLNGLLP